MDNKKTQIRGNFRAVLQVRETSGNGRILEGRAISFNQPSELLTEDGLTFTEYIEPSCITESFLKSQDIKLNLLHDRNSSFARSNQGAGTLQLIIKPDGLYFRVEVPKCDIGNRALELVKNGTYTGCSFEFCPDKYTTEKGNNDTYIIRHKSFARLSAITIGMDPAYKSTTVSARETFGVTTNRLATGIVTAPLQAKERRLAEAKAIQYCKDMREIHGVDSAQYDNAMFKLRSLRFKMLSSTEQEARLNNAKKAWLRSCIEDSENFIAESKNTMRLEKEYRELLDCARGFRAETKEQRVSKLKELANNIY